jgi:hypothetical protein
MGKVFHFIVKEIREILPAMIYFLIAFHFIMLIQALILEQYGIEPASSVAATIAALIVAKAILVADALPFINRFPGRPLVFNVAWKTVIYGLVSFLFRYLEEVLPKIGDAGGFVAANRQVFDEIVWPHFWAVQSLMLVTIIGYVCFAEIDRSLGEGRLRAMFFGGDARRA